MTAFEIFELGDHALVATAVDAISFEIQRRIWQIAACARQWPDVEEAIPGMNNLTLLFDPLVADLPRLRAALDAACAEPGGPVGDDPYATHEVSVRYGGRDGPDLETVARLADIPVDEVIERHSCVEYIVFFIGFQPGFAYLGGLDPRLATPRHKEPRLKVPAGSVGIGGSQTGVYPTESPGGWQLIGRTAEVLFDPARAVPARLSPGDRVRFVPTGPNR
ncbi:5-oxoprolinase subunit PxpB [Pararobbsia alpina]|nr:5-oxoprolinase subunit PxpB [Pararobbsia alpina]